MKRVLALLAALLSLGAFAACGKPAEISPTQAPVLGSEYTTRQTRPDPTGAPAGDTTAPGEETTPEEQSTAEATTAPGETTTAEPATTTAKAAEAATPTGAAAIVRFYNEAANNTKNQKDFTAVKSDKLDCNITEGVLTIVNSALSDLRKDAPNQREVFKNGRGTIDTGRTPQSFLPVENRAYMSQLQAGWVKSAACVKNGDGSFTVKLALKEETFLAKTEDPGQHHSCMDTLNVDWNGLPFAVHDETRGRIYDAVITAVVAPDGKLLRELHIYEPVEVKGQVQVIVWANITVAGYWKQDIIFS